MSIWNKLFPSEKAVEKTLDGVINGLDKVVYTDEEKAEARAKARDWYLDYIKSTTGFNLARRYIALVVTSMWTLWTSTLGAFNVAGVIWKEGATYDFIGAAEALQHTYGEITTVFGTVMLFYFAGRLIPNGEKK